MEILTPPGGILVRTPEHRRKCVNQSLLPRRRSRRRLLGEALAAAAAAPFVGLAARPAAAASQGVTTPDGRYYDAYTPAATKDGQWYQYSCEFDASWAVLAT